MINTLEEFESKFESVIGEKSVGVAENIRFILVVEDINPKVYENVLVLGNGCAGCSIESILRELDRLKHNSGKAVEIPDNVIVEAILKKSAQPDSPVEKMKES